MRFSIFASLALLASCRAVEYGGFNDDWSFDLDSAQNTDWMSSLDDLTPLSMLSIPGTHNSLTYKLDHLSLQGQNVPLIDQLIAGIRYFDISCHVLVYELVVYHGPSSTCIRFEDVMDIIFSYLDDHPRETVVLRIQKHNPFESSEAFLSILEKHLSPGSDSGDRAINRLFSKGEAGITDIPTLGEVRGKVFILQDFKTRVPGRYGLPWSSPKVSVYNFRVTVKTFLLGLKWRCVKAFINAIPGHKKLSITHTTASVGVRPIEIAAGSGSSEGMNARLGAFLKKKTESKKPLHSSDRVGIIAMDYPGKKIVDQILELNNHYRVSRPM